MRRRAVFLPVNGTARTDDELRREYDLASLTCRVQGKYYERARAGSNLVLVLHAALMSQYRKSSQTARQRSSTAITTTEKDGKRGV